MEKARQGDNDADDLIQTDAQLLASTPPLPPRRRCAVIVRLGEKRILQKTIERVEDMLAKAAAVR